MSQLARWCFQHRRWVVAGWLLAMVVVVGAERAAGTDFSSSFSLPNTDSQAAVTLLTQNFPSASGEGDQVVIQATHGATISSAAVRTSVTAALAKVARVPGVQAVTSPYTKAGAAQISRDGTVAFARVTWGKQAAQVTAADARNLIKAAESADATTVHISLSGQSITNSERPSPGQAGQQHRATGCRHGQRGGIGSPHTRGGVGDARGDLAEREGHAGHRLPRQQPAGRADRQPGEPPAP
jgi:RND superfamily putative drug exporter